MIDELRAFSLDAIKAMNYDTSDITDATPLGPAGVDLESLGMAELGLRIEDKYGVVLAEEDLERLASLTLGDFLAEVADRHTGGGPA
nr:phosphopantetheine-binding protein [Longispora albida]